MSVPMKVIMEVVANYPIGSSFKIKKIECGLANNTYLISTDSDQYILQRLHEIYSYEVIIDLDAVSKFLMDYKNNGVITRGVVRTKDGDLWIEVDGRIWRLLTYIRGKVYERVKYARMAFEAGGILGRFHRVMSKFGYKFKNPRSPAHDTHKVYQMFVNAEASEVSPEARWLADRIHEMPSLMNLEKNVMVVAHGDPKISNIVFKESGLKAKAIGLIDLDGCMPNYLLLELGDAFRSWCGGYEDDPDNQFNLRLFSQAFKGYMEQFGRFVDPDEFSRLTKAIKLITLELASRFLRDYFLDKYFAWDATRYSSRKEHNLARTIGQIALYDDVVKKEERIMNIINDYCHV